jgi:uncharacterized membrane protein YphA (DoxX/SURF4 family)
MLFGPPPKLLGLLPMPRLSTGQFIAAGVGLIGALVLAAAGVLTRPMLVAAVVCHLLYFSQITGLSYVQRKPNLIAVCLIILAVAPGVDAPLISPAPVWPILLVYAALAQMYWSSGFQKLRHSGPGWARGQTLRAHLAQHHLWAGTSAARWLASRPGLCLAASALVLSWELSFPVVLAVPSLVPLFALAGAAFHVGNRVFLRIDYLTYLSPVYTVFLTDWLMGPLLSLGWISSVATVVAVP